MKTDTLLFGAAYYDEYLPEDRIEIDMEMMKRAGAAQWYIKYLKWEDENILDEGRAYQN